MSWSSYIENLKAYPTVSEACICGHDGGVWAQSDGFSMSPAELQKLAKTVVSGVVGEQISYNGQNIISVKCSAEDGYCGKFSEQICLSAYATKTGVVICVNDAGPSGKVPVACLQKLCTATDSIGKYLTNSNM